MNVKKASRLRRARRARAKIRELRTVRLTVNRTPRHIYAQVLSAEGSTVLACASTLDKDLRTGTTGNVDAATAVGKLIAERAKAPALKRLPLIAAALSTTAVLGLWLTLPAKPV